MMFLVAVHTTGVNWQGVLANVASITVVLGVVATVLSRQIKNSIKVTIHDVIASDVKPVLEKIEAELREHDTRLARLEGMEEGKKQAMAAANVTTTTHS